MATAVGTKRRLLADTEEPTFPDFSISSVRKFLSRSERGERALSIVGYGGLTKLEVSENRISGVHPFNLRLDLSLAGRVPGTHQAFYNCSVTSNTDRQLSFSCDCPDWGDPCKVPAFFNNSS